MWPYLAVAGLATACYTNALYGEFVHDDVVAVSRNPDVLGSSSVYQLLRNDFWGTPLVDPRSHKSYRPLTTLTFRLNYWLCGLQPASYHGLNLALHVTCCLLFTRAALVVAGLQAGFATVAGLLTTLYLLQTQLRAVWAPASLIPWSQPCAACGLLSAVYQSGSGRGCYRLNYWLCGLQPASYHGLNLALHVACCLLFTRAALVVAGLQAGFATVAGLLFAAHPIHTEGVAGIVGRADVLACFLFLLSFLIYHDEGWRLPGGSSGKVACSCVMAALSMLAKETGLTVLLVNLGYDLYKCWPHVKRVVAEARWNEESLLFARRTAKILVATSMLLAFRLAMLQGALPKFSSQDNPAAFHPCPYVRLLTFCYLAAFNWWLLVCPSTLSHDWQMGSIPLVTSLADCRNLTTALFLTCCVLIAYRCAADFEAQRHAPLVLAGLLLAAPFLPATNLLFTVGFVVAERVLYMPSLGGVLLVAYGAQQLHGWCGPRPRRRLFLLLGLLLLVTSFSCRTFVRNNDWATRESLVRAGIKALPHNAKMHYNLANYLRDTNVPDLAITHYKEAIRLWPRYASAHNNLGTLMSSPNEAENHFLSAITISPSHVNAHYNLGQVYRKMNRTMEAVTMLERCLRLDTSYSPAYLVLAKLRSPPIAARLLYHVTQLTILLNVQEDEPYDGGGDDAREMSELDCCIT
ncbi:protein O-mannosyl-transferase TMTC1-like [Macrosteles quadrilineatus]|uniref:protein O-mannosyl-transferase TMTC1-like n=1 Tax=Macrosteles quadrilineatus TaxID=74068 RepID=UPI0023E207C9|nr:protein O-mannosyl-transferase TMTC1-like [Macrosteles quadrilineatus]